MEKKLEPRRKSRRISCALACKEVVAASCDKLSACRKEMEEDSSRDQCETNSRVINDLPQEMLAEIFSYLSVEDLAFRVKLVSRRWAEVIKDPRIWKHLSYRPLHGTSISEVIEVLTQAPKLEVVNVSCQEGTDMSILQAICKNCKHIKKLALSVNRANSETVKALLTCSLRHSVEKLKIILVGIDDGAAGGSFDEKEFLKVVGECTNLQSLTLYGILHLHDQKLFEGIAGGCPKLQELNVLFLCGFDQQAFKLLLENWSEKILSLNLDWNWSQSKSTLPIVSSCCKKLEKLHVGCYSSEPAKLPDLFKDSKIVPDDFTALKEMHGLKELCMPHLGNSNLEPFMDLFGSRHLQNLVKLNLSYVDCVENQLLWAIFANSKNLRYLNIMGCSKVQDDGFDTINCLKKLEHLNIESCSQITDRGVSYIVQCEMLRYLNLMMCPKLSVKSFKLCCKSLKLLYEIQFNSCNLSDDDLVDIPKHLLKFFDHRNQSTP